MKTPRFIDISELAHFEVSCSDGKQYVLIPVEHLSDIPTVDATEVVPCKDCAWYDCNGDNEWGICSNPHCTQSFYGCRVREQHFCSRGERRDDVKKKLTFAKGGVVHGSVDFEIEPHETILPLKYIQDIGERLASVVRCKDCIWKEHWYRTDYGFTVCGMSGLYVVEDSDFCSYGERMATE